MNIRSILTKTGIGLAALGLCLQVAMVNPQPVAAATCGSACNGQPPSYNSCNSSAVQVGQGHPKATYRSVDANGNLLVKTETDTNMLVKVMYSTSCRTLWGVVSNLRAIGRVECKVYVVRTYNPVWNNIPLGCPSAGNTLTTRMVDDQHPNFGIAAKVELKETVRRNICGVSYGGNGTTCTVIYYNQLVEFTYRFDY